MDGVALCEFFKVFHRPLSTSVTDGREQINDNVVIALRRVICLTTHPHSTERPEWSHGALVHLHWTSRSGGQQLKKYGDVAHLSRATGHVYERKFDESVNVMQSVLIQRRRSKNFRQVRFFLINAIFFFIKPDFPNPHFTPLSWLDVHFINPGIQVCY